MEDDDDVDSQLQLQDDFMTKGKAPAAKVTRVIRGTPASVLQTQIQTPAPVSTPPASKPVTTNDDTLPGSLTASIPGILGNVLERHSHLLAPSNPGAIADSAHEPAAFPAACHRKQSKFALSRKTALPLGSNSQPNNTVTAQPQRPLQTRPVDENPPPPYQPGTNHQPRAAIPTDPSVSEVQAISRASLQQVSSLSSQAAAAALEEVAERITPATLAFLKARGAKKMLAERNALGNSGSADLADSASTSPSSGFTFDRSTAPRKVVTLPGVPALTGQASATAAVAQPPAAAAGTRSAVAGAAAVASAGKSRNTAAVQSGLSGLEPASLSRGSAKKADGSSVVGGKLNGSPANGAGAQDSAVEEPGVVADPRPVARLRWGLHGEVVGLQREDERVVDEEVLKRDVLRQDEGSAPEGYSLGELLILARSSVPAQRAMSMHMLSDIMSHARPRIDDLSEQGKARSKPVPIPSDVRLILGPAVTVTWHEVWFFNVTQLVVVAHLRLALDDEIPSVAAAAAGALAAVVGMSLQEQTASELADGSTPASCWPAVRTGYLARPHAAATWEGAPVSYENPGAVVSGMVPQGGGPDDETPEDVATIDPLAGLLQMHVLQRFRFLLEVVPHRSAIQPALLCLMACATASEQAARAVVECPRMMNVLTTILRYAAAPVTRTQEDEESRTTSGGAANGGRGKSSVRRLPTSMAPGSSGGQKENRQGGGDSLGQDVGYTLPEVLSCLRLIRLLCQSSKEIARAVCMSGALDSIPSIIIAYSPELREMHVSSTHSQAGGDSSSSHLIPELMQLEALRVWRICAHQGLCLASVTDMYPYIVSLLSPHEQPQPPSPTTITASPTPVSAPPTSQRTATAGQNTASAHAVEPLAVAAGSSVSSTSGLDPSASASRRFTSPTAESVRWSSSCEAYLTLTALVRHAQALEFRQESEVAGGAGEEGKQEAVFQMISPGIAAAVAQEDALLWLQPGHLLRMARVMVELASKTLPLAVERFEIRTTLGVHPTLLVPAAVACGRCLSAVLDFLAAYWATLDAAAVAGAGGQIRSAVSRSGLLDPNLSPNTLSSSSSSQEDLKVLQPVTHLVPVLSAEDRLVSHLLGKAVVPDNAQVEQKDAAIQNVTGALLSALFLEEACAASLMRTQQVKAQPTRLHVLLMRASSGSILHSLLSLATAINPQTSQSHNSWQHVESLSLHLVRSAPALLMSASPSPAKSLAPWQLLRMQLQQPTTAAFLLAARLYSSAVLATPSPASARDSVVGAEQQTADAQLTMMDGCLAILATAPPGAEATCLRALQLALAPHNLARVLPAALRSCSVLPAACPKLVAAASATTAQHSNPWAYTVGTLVTEAVPSATQLQSQPLHTGASVPEVTFAWATADIATVSATLIASYAASWLSLLALPQPHAQTHSSGNTHTGSSSSSSAEQNPPLLVELQQPYLECSPGSRLPLPPTWLIDEVHALPTTSPHHANANIFPDVLSSVSGTGRVPMTAIPEEEARAETDESAKGSDVCQGEDVGVQAVSRALLLALGLEACGSSYTSRLPTAVKLTAMLQLAYLFNAQELVAGQVGGKGQRSSCKQEDGEGPSQWRDVAVRCPLAALTHHFVCHGTSVKLPSAWCSVRLGERLSELLATSSFGDPLLALHVGLLLLPTTNPAVQAQVWATLAHEQALHLLPRTDAMLGCPSDYLDTPCTDPRVLQPFSRALLEGDLAKALSMGGLDPDLAPTTPQDSNGKLKSQDPESSGTRSNKADVQIDSSAPIAVNVVMGTLAVHVGLCGTGRSSVVGSGGEGGGLGSVGEGGTLTGGRGEEFVERHAQGLLRALVNGLHPSVLVKVLRHGQALGGVPADQARLLIRVCGGDVSLIERAKWALQSMGML